MMLISHCDGSIKGGNPGGWAVGGWTLYDNKCQLLQYGTVDLKQSQATTNNLAEYAAIWGVMDWTCSYYPGALLIVCSDSQLAINHLDNKWCCGSEPLMKWRDRIWNRSKEMEQVVYKWIPREINKDADEVSRFLYEPPDQRWPADKYHQEGVPF